MPARRCTLCGISYPTLGQFQTCPVHDEPTDYITNIDPDEDWQKGVERLLRQAEKDAALKAFVPLVPGVKTFEASERLWVNQEEMFNAGARFNSAFGGFHLFTLDDGWIYETQGWDETRRRWWVEQVIRSEEETSPPTTNADVPSSTESATD